MFNRILVPLDGSKLAELALPYAEKLAGAFNSEVDIVGVCEQEESQYCHMQKAYIEKVAEVVRNYIKKAGSVVEVKSLILDGEPAAEIIRYAEKEDISLIAMATHGRSGIKLWAMGSVANKVLQRISMPILLIRAKAPALKAGEDELFSKILVPLDGSTISEAVLPYIMELTKKLNSEVTLFQIIAPGKHVHTIGGLDYVRFAEQDVESMRANAQKYLKEVSRRFKDTKATVKYELKLGDTAAEIIKFADKTNASLVAMSTRGHSAIERWTLGSVTHKILDSSNKHILLVRAQG